MGVAGIVEEEEDTVLEEEAVLFVGDSELVEFWFCLDEGGGVTRFVTVGAVGDVTKGFKSSGGVG